jgi:Ca2+-binding RTX toxin-like protein
LLLRDDAFLGGGNDRYEAVVDNFQTINGGPGNDTINPRGGRGAINGDDGADLIGAASPQPAPAFGVWTLNGGAGNDTFRIGHHSSRDVVAGGAGTDAVSYLGRAQGVRVDQTVSNGDGGFNEADDIGPDIEKLVGTDFSDTLIGGDVDNEIVGGLGSDNLRGGGGFDRIVAGDDGVPETAIDCGTQPKASVSLLTTVRRDRAVVDLVDPAPTGCEVVESAPKNEHPTVQISRAARSGRVLRVTLACPKGAKRTCQGTLALVVAGRTAVKTTHRLTRGTTRTFRLRLPAALARRAAAGAVPATIEAREKAADGRAKRTSARVSL